MGWCCLSLSASQNSHILQPGFKVVFGVPHLQGFTSTGSQNHQIVTKFAGPLPLLFKAQWSQPRFFFFTKAFEQNLRDTVSKLRLSFPLTPILPNIKDKPWGAVRNVLFSSWEAVSFAVCVAPCPEKWIWCCWAAGDCPKWSHFHTPSFSQGITGSVWGMVRVHVLVSVWGPRGTP